MINAANFDILAASLRFI